MSVNIFILDKLYKQNCYHRKYIDMGQNVKQFMLKWVDIKFQISSPAQYN